MAQVRLTFSISSSCSVTLDNKRWWWFAGCDTFESCVRDDRLLEFLSDDDLCHRWHSTALLYATISWNIWGWNGCAFSGLYCVGHSVFRCYWPRDSATAWQECHSLSFALLENLVPSWPLPWHRNVVFIMCKARLLSMHAASDWRFEVLHSAIHGLIPSRKNMHLALVNNKILCELALVTNKT